MGAGAAPQQPLVRGGRLQSGVAGERCKRALFGFSNTTYRCKAIGPVAGPLG